MDIFNKHFSIGLFLVLQICVTTQSKGQTNISGFISSDVTWDVAGSPYLITGNTVLDSGFTLTIDAGVIVKFHRGKSLQIQGNLRAIGSAEHPIMFTSNEPVPAPGDWDFIFFSDNSQDFDHSLGTGSVLEHCVVEYVGGNSGQENGAIKIYEAFPFINSCEIRHNSATAINYWDSGTTYGRIKITNCNIHDNDGTASSHTSGAGGISIRPSWAHSAVPTEIVNNIIRNNSGDNAGGINCSHSTENLLIKGNIIMDNRGQYGAIVASFSNGEIAFNLVVENRSLDENFFSGMMDLVYSDVVVKNNILAGNAGGLGSNGNVLFSKNVMVDNSFPVTSSLFFIRGTTNNISHNTIVHNNNASSGHSTVRVSEMPTFVFNGNNIYGNGTQYELWNEYPSTFTDLNACNNWWKAAASNSIDLLIYDFFDDNSKSVVDYIPFATSPDTIAPMTPVANIIKNDIAEGNIQLKWDANGEQDLAGYRIYWGPSNGYSFSNAVDVGNVLTYTLAGLSINDTIAVTAYDRDADAIQDQLEGHESWFTYAVVKPNPEFSVLNTTVCAHDTLLLINRTRSEDSNIEWSWSFPGGSPAVSTTKNPKVIYDRPGVYSVSLKATNIAGADSLTIDSYITVDSPPDPKIIPDGPVVFCEGDSVTLDGGAGCDSYSWSNSAAQQTITARHSGKFTVVVSNRCGSGTDEIAVTVNPPPEVSITADGPTTFCAGDSVVLTAGDGNSFLWSSGDTTQNITAWTANEYSVKVAAANGCFGTSEVMKVTVNPLPEATISLADSVSFCDGDSVVLAASSATTYLWSTGETTPEIVVRSSAGYSVTVASEQGCESTSTVTRVTVYTQPTALITADRPTTFCAGDSVTLSASDAYSYLWSNGDTSRHVVVRASGEYTVTVTDVHGCIAGSEVTAVTANPLPEPIILPDGPTTFCAGDSVVLSANTGSRFLWTTAETAKSISVLSAGSYAVAVVDENGCSASSDTAVVIVKPLPEIYADDVSRCGDGVVTLTATGSGTKTWFSSPDGGSPISTGDTLATPHLTATTTYYIASELNGCATRERLDVNATVIIIPKPAISASNDNSSQPLLTSSSDSGNQWFNEGIPIAGEIEKTYLVTEDGSYTVQVSVGNCFSPMSDPFVFVVTGLSMPNVWLSAIYPNPATDK